MSITRCSHLSWLDRANGLTCTVCDPAPELGEIDARYGRIILSGSPAERVIDSPPIFDEELVAEALLKSRRELRAERIRGIIQTLLPWLATGVGVASFVVIIYLVEGLTS